jgi:UDP-N-acetylmuramate--alanine ligase
MMTVSRHVHLIGIGGSGLSAIATLLLERGYRVSGSDRQETPLLHRLQQAGVQVFVGHRAENIAGADLIVRSSAVQDQNAEVRAAVAAGVPVLKRSEFLAELISDQRCIAVAGTHGKTTTTAMIAWMLHELGQDPSYVIGGASTDLGASAHAGQGAYFAIEADEYDRMFLGLQPWLAVVTNVEHDHPDCYPTPQDFYQAFMDFAARLQPGGTLVACADDPGAARLAAEARAAGKQAVTYAIQKPSQSGDPVPSATGAAFTSPTCWADGPVPNRVGGFTFTAFWQGEGFAVPVVLHVPGLHNVRNALAALSSMHLLGLPMEPAIRALSRFTGAGRRFDLRGEVSGVLLVDDYAHHPTEIRATLAAARARYPQHRIWAVWQPHTYSRTRTLFTEFAASFADADCVVVTEIYAARETAPVDGFSGQRLAAAISATGHPRVSFALDLAQAQDYLLSQVRPGDVVLVLSAGDADQINVHLAQGLAGDAFIADVDIADAPIAVEAPREGEK